MTLEEMRHGLRRGYSCVNPFLEQFYHHGAAGQGGQGLVREFLDGPPEGVTLSWTRDR
jgi:hypothetical protein